MSSTNLTDSPSIVIPDACNDNDTFLNDVEYDLRKSEIASLLHLLRGAQLKDIDADTLVAGLFSEESLRSNDLYAEQIVQFIGRLMECSDECGMAWLSQQLSSHRNFCRASEHLQLVLAQRSMRREMGQQLTSQSS